MTEARMSPEQDNIFAETDIAAPPERVFQALVDEKQLRSWWGKEPTVELLQFDMEGRAGGKFQYKCRPKAGNQHSEFYENLRKKGEDAFACHGEVLESVPPKLLVWSWVANWHEHPDHATKVRWELTPTKNGTHVRVTHSGLAQEPISRKDYAGGWQGVLRLLQTHVQQR
jgi:uncharacterized protein YndB with AHSA1/START domain